MKKPLFTLIVTLLSIASFAQYQSTLSEDKWVDSVFKSLSREQKIAQLMVIRAHSNLPASHVKGVTDLITKYNVGALCFFQGGPVRQALLTNLYQSLAKTPLMVTIDGEWGLGMRLDSVEKFPYQLTLGALSDPKLVYDMGVAVGEQMKRIGVHVNYAPVVDVNNNPGNPVIGYRSFGEDKYKVADLGVAYTKGMQDAGIMACAKHFPGHGDTEVDSHYDLPVINKTVTQLDSLELYPFQALFKAGVGSVMIAHLSIPAIDNTKNRPTSLSKANVTELLRDQMGYKGLTFTDALEMKGVTKFYPAGEAAVQAIIAGNDMLCLPDDVPAAIAAIEAAVKAKRLKWNDIEDKVRKVLHAKYELGLNKTQWVNTANLLEDINAKTGDINKAVARQAITVLRNNNAVFPFRPGQRIAYVGLGAAAENDFAKRLKQDFGADVFLFSYKDAADKATTILQQIDTANYSAVIIGVHDFNYRPANNYSISAAAMNLWKGLQKGNTATFLFGNVYAAKNFCDAKNLVAMHQDDAHFQRAAADFLRGAVTAQGVLPVTVCSFQYGSGLVVNNRMPAGVTPAWLKIDSIVNNAIANRAFPGAVILVVQGGEIKYHKAFGKYEYASGALPVTLESIYDLASVTKISATTVAIMKLYEQGKIDLTQTIGHYLPWTAGTNKAEMTLEDILLHQAGLVPFIPFYKETVDATGAPKGDFYRARPEPGFGINVARNMYLRNDWRDTLFQRILASPVSPRGKYIYSDNDFIFLAQIVETVSGMPLDQYVSKTFYRPLGMATTTFRAGERFGVERIVPTEQESGFRQQVLRGDVHDEGASLFGGVAGHAGLFSNAYDLSLLYQMLLNGGEFNGERYFKPETIEKFTAYQTPNSRRGLGFDKPERDNATSKSPYPSLLASPQTYGHTGFTGTCVWVDPQSQLVYIFLSNRVHPSRSNNKISTLSVRGQVQDAIYRAIKSDEAAKATVTPLVTQTDEKGF